MQTHEERIKSELLHLGLIPDQDFDEVNTHPNTMHHQYNSSFAGYQGGAQTSGSHHDYSATASGFGHAKNTAHGGDEVLHELRRLQLELRSQMETNQHRKACVLQAAEDYMGWQNYNNLLDELSKQVETAHSKRFKGGKRKKKPQTDPVPIPENLIALMNKRDTVISRFRPIVSSDRFTIPERSIFAPDPEEANGKASDAPATAQQVSSPPPPAPPAESRDSATAGGVVELDETSTEKT